MASANGATNDATNGSTNGSSMNGSHTVSPFSSQSGLEAPPLELHLMSDQHDCTQSADAERRRLEDDIAAAKRRAAASQQRIEASENNIREGLRAELSASKDALAAIERQHEVTVAMIRNAAQAEVQRILTDTRQGVASSDPRLNHSHQHDSHQAGFSNAE